MTMAFWLALALLVLLALLFVFYPLASSRTPQKGVTQRDQNLATYRSRMKELEEEFQAELIDQETFDALKADLEVNLLEDVGEDDAAEPSSSNSRGVLWGVTLVAVLTVPVATFLAYDYWGAYDDVASAQVMNQIQGGEAGTPDEMDRLTQQLQQRLERNPDNPDGWLMLARTHMTLQQFGPAADAFARLAELGGDDSPQDAAAAWGLSALARFFDQQGRVGETTREAINNALQLDQREVNARAVLGVEAFRQGDFRAAVDNWQVILEDAPDHPLFQGIRDDMVHAYNELGEPVPDEFMIDPVAEEAASEQEVMSGDAALEFTVQLSDQAQQDVSEDSTVFVYARPVDGPPRPLAITRLEVDDLPAEVRLDSTMAMTPEDAMTPGQEVMLVARVSRDGNATPQPGDWEGEAGPFPAGTHEPGIILRVDAPIREEGDGGPGQPQL